MLKAKLLPLRVRHTPQASSLSVVGEIQEIYRSSNYDDCRPFDCTVAICFASHRSTLADAVGSLVNQKNSPNIELLLISNNTQDDSVEVAIGAAGPLAVRVIQCESAGYVANARNAAFISADSGKIIFLDADDEAGECYVRSLYEGLKKYPLVTSIWEFKKLNQANYPGIEDYPPRTFPLRWEGWTYSAEGAMGVRKKTAQEIGGFSFELGPVAGNEWCFRAYAGGYEIQCIPEAITHYRFRPTIWSSYKQYLAWGYWEVAAAKKASAYGLPHQSFGNIVKGYRHLVHLGRRARSKAGRRAFATHTALLVGHLYGSLSFLYFLI